MALKLIIQGRLPGLNEIIAWNKQKVPYLSRGKRKVFEYTIKKAEIEDKLVTCFLLQVTKPKNGINFLDLKVKLLDKPLYNKCNITFHWFEPNKRRDPSNVCAGGRKFILDALVKANILTNDNWLLSEFSDRFYISRDNPRIELWIAN